MLLLSANLTSSNGTTDVDVTCEMTSRRELDVVEYTVLLLFLWCSKIGLVSFTRFMRRISWSHVTRNLFTYVIEMIRGIWRALVALVGFCMPSFSMLTVAVLIYLLYSRGQPKEGPIPSKVPVSIVPPVGEIPIDLAPSSVAKQNEKEELLGTTPSVAPVPSAVKLTGNDVTADEKPEVAPSSHSIDDKADEKPLDKPESSESKPDVLKDDPDKASEPKAQQQSIETPAKPAEQAETVTEKSADVKITPAEEATNIPVSEEIIESIPVEKPLKDTKIPEEILKEQIPKTVEDIAESSKQAVKGAEDKAKGADGAEDPIVAEQHEDIPSFDEWKKKALAEEEKKLTNGKFVHVSEPNSLKTRPSTMRTNYASLSCGAKVLAHNPEVQHAEYVLSDNKDQYMINPCKTEKKWFVVELCEPIQVKFIDIANFELFSSLPESFKVYTSDRYPSKDWKWLGTFYAKPERKIQSFSIDWQELYSKYVRIEMLSHHGTEHFCPISLLRIFGKSYADIDDDDHQDGAHDDLSSDGSGSAAADESGSGNIFTSATDMVINVVKKVLNVNGQDSDVKPVNATIPPEEKAVNGSSQQAAETTPQPDCPNDQSNKLDQIKPDLPRPDVQEQPDEVADSAQLEPSQPKVPTPTPVTPSVDTPNTILLTSLVRSQCSACSIRQSNYRTYRPILGPSRCVYMYTMVGNAHARECSCRRCRRQIPPSIIDHSVVTPPIVEKPTKQTLSLAVSSGPETDIGVSLVTETTLKIQPTPATVQTTDAPLSDSETTPTAGPEVAQPQPESQESSTVAPSSEEIVKQVETFVSTESTTTILSDQTVVSENPVKPVESVKAPAGGADNQTESVGSDADQAVTPQNPPDVEEGLENGDGALTESGLDFLDQNSEQPVGGPASAGKRESAIMRINNRLKKLELNMSLSSRYLEELSQMYRKQMDNMYRSFNKTIARLTNTSRLAAISEQRQQENIQSLRRQLGELGNTVASLQKTLDNMHIKYLETHLFWILIETLIMVAVMITCTRRGTSAQQVQAMIDGRERPRARTLSRRASDSHLHGSPHKSLLKRSGSDSNLYIIEPSVPLFLDEQASSDAPKEKRRRKPRKSKRSLGSAPTRSTVADDTLLLTNGYHGNHSVSRSLSMENLALSDVLTTSSSSQEMTSHHSHQQLSRNQFQKPVEFIGPLDFYEKRKKKKSGNKENFPKNRRKNPNHGLDSDQSQPVYNLVQNGGFGVKPRTNARVSPRNSPRVSPQMTRRHESPEYFPHRPEFVRPWRRSPDGHSDILRGEFYHDRPHYNSQDTNSEPCRIYKRGKFIPNKSKAKVNQDSMER